MLSGLFFASIYFMVDKTPLEYENLTVVTGELEYCRVQGGKSSYFAIGLKDHNTEYHLSSIYSLDGGFEESVSKGSEITLYIEENTERAFDTSKTDLKKWTYFYYLSANGTEYLDYSDYLRYFNENKSIGYLMSIVGVSVAAISIIVWIASHIYYKFSKKKEYINIYK